MAYSYDFTINDFGRNLMIYKSSGSANDNPSGAISLGNNTTNNNQVPVYVNLQANDFDSYKSDMVVYSKGTNTGSPPLNEDAVLHITASSYGTDGDSSLDNRNATLIFSDFDQMATQKAQIIYNTWNNKLSFKNGSATNMVMDNTGKVGIGTSTLTDTLTVKGTIKAKEITVDVNVADYVFKNDYSLMSLEETEQFIQNNKHLPNIPGEKEVTADGFKVGEFQNKLLEKIEELTLHLIAQNKELKNQKAKMVEMEKTISDLRK